MILGFRLTLKALPDGRLCLAMPIFYRALLAAIGLLILLSLLLTAPEEESGLLVPANTVPLIICIVSFLGAAYHERWLFDRDRDSVSHQYGLVFAHANRRYRLSDMSRIELEQFAKGQAAGREPPRGLLFRAGQVLTLSLHGKDGTVHRLETYAASQRPRLLNAARRLAEHCGLPLMGGPEAEP